MTDSVRQRLNMVESQIRPSDVTDRRILRAMGEIARETYVPEAVAQLAYMDEVVPLQPAGSRTARQARSLMSPRTFAKLVQLAAIEPGDTVLDVGAGRGYSAAVLARLAKSVIALECDALLAEAATLGLKAAPNVTVVCGPLEKGLPDKGPFDVIVLEGSIYGDPSVLLAQLEPGGRLVGIRVEGRLGQATVWRRTGDGFGRTESFEAAGGQLPGFEPVAAFIF